MLARTRLIMMTVIATLLGSGVVAALAGFVVLRAGWYDIGATTQHFPFVYSMLEQGMHYSVRRHAKSVAEPASAIRLARLPSASFRSTLPATQPNTVAQPVASLTRSPRVVQTSFTEAASTINAITSGAREIPWPQRPS